MQLTDYQRDVAERTSGMLSLTGIAGTGKTTAAAGRVRHLLQSGIPGQSVLVLVPHRGLGAVYQDVLQQTGWGAGGSPQLLTLASLARRMVDLFWPLVVDDSDCGFSDPAKRPTFLTLETSQYYMARIIEPLMVEQGYFDSVAVPLPRLCSQILDNLNKAAVVGFGLEDITPRLKSAWVGDQAQRRVYEDVGQAAMLFRAYCLEHNLLDYSLQIETFVSYLWGEPLCRDMVLSSVSHCVADAIEEDTPAAHTVLMEIMGTAESALIVQDTDGGYRRFLGASPEDTTLLHDLCDKHVEFTQSLIMSPPIETLCINLGKSLGAEPLPAAPLPTTKVRDALSYKLLPYQPAMVGWAAEQVANLIRDEGVPPSQIAILAPFLGDTLRFTLETELAKRDVRTRSLRPSRSLRDEPASRTLLELAALAHPRWNLQPRLDRIASAFLVALNIDWPRAFLLAERLVTGEGDSVQLLDFAELPVHEQQRVSYVYGERYEDLRTLLNGYAEHPQELDVFFSLVFDQLVEPGFGFERNADAARAVDALILSCRRFRQAVPEASAQDYVEFVQQGVISARYYTDAGQSAAEGAVLLAPAYTFLLSNQPVDFLVLLEIGSPSWYRRLFQPLTHPYVLSREWLPGQVWDDAKEVAYSNRAIQALMLGLLRRCRQGVILGLSQVDIQGYEQSGPLLSSINRVLRWAAES